MPGSPADLLAAEPRPLERFRIVTELVKSHFNNWLPDEWAELRMNDLRTLLTATPPVPQSVIAAETGLSRPRVYRLAEKALGESRP